jgi:hypothetical protein
LPLTGVPYVAKKSGVGQLDGEAVGDGDAAGDGDALGAGDAPSPVVVAALSFRVAARARAPALVVPVLVDRLAVRNRPADALPVKADPALLVPGTTGPDFPPPQATSVMREPNPARIPPRVNRGSEPSPNKKNLALSRAWEHRRRAGAGARRAKRSFLVE